MGDILKIIMQFLNMMAFSCRCVSRSIPLRIQKVKCSTHIVWDHRVK